MPGPDMAAPGSIVVLDAVPGQSTQPFDYTTAVALLLQAGAVLIRGFSASLEQFQQVTARFVDDFHQVGTRRAVEDEANDGRTSEVPRSNYNLFVHSEGSYRPVPPPPDLCFFHCVKPPACPGGETLLVDGVPFLHRLPDELRQRFEQQGVIYEALWDAPRWQIEFQVDSLAELDELVARHPECSYRNEGDFLRVRCRMPAIRTTLGGLPSFANGLLAHLPAISHPRWRQRGAYSRPNNRVYFGDGEEISAAVVNRLIDIQDDLALAHAWQADEMLILDNTRFMHGRRKTEGECERRIRSRFGQLRPEFRNQG